MSAHNCRVRDAVAIVARTAERETWGYTNKELRDIIRDLWSEYVAHPNQRDRVILLTLTMEVERMEGWWERE